jgi:hypothetical protein
MTDEERQNLALKLRAARPGYPPGELCVQAADEIERLARLVEDYKLTFGDIHDVSTPSNPDDQHRNRNTDGS